MDFVFVFHILYAAACGSMVAPLLNTPLYSQFLLLEQNHAVFVAMAKFVSVTMRVKRQMAACDAAYQWSCINISTFISDSYIRYMIDCFCSGLLATIDCDLLCYPFQIFSLNNVS